MGLFGSKSEGTQPAGGYDNGNTRDRSEPDGAKHAAVSGANLDATRLGTEGYEPKHSRN